MKRIQEESAFVLHRKPYLETSLLLDVLTEQHGRVQLVARGGRRTQCGQGFLWQPFIPLKVSCQGKTELLTATQVEKEGPAISLSGQALLTGLYLNELLILVLPKQDAYPEIFHAYAKTLKQLQLGVQECVLRSFEKKLLGELGYGLHANQDIDHRPIDEQAYYQLHPDKGFEYLATVQSKKAVDVERFIFSGKIILEFMQETWSEESLFAAKYIMRLLFRPLLNDQRLKTRELFL